MAINISFLFYFFLLFKIFLVINYSESSLKIKILLFRSHVNSIVSLNNKQPQENNITLERENDRSYM
jgi:hypothetical protein